MKIGVVSYSLTGNNEALAEAVAKSLSAEHIKIVEPKPRKTGAIIADMMFNRTPKSQPAPDVLAQYDQVVLMGPVWLGKVASPLRAYLKYIKKHPKPYAFACISGGALNPNPKLKDDIAGRAGAQPAACIDLHIADLLPKDTKPSMESTSGYHLSAEDVAKLSATITDTIREALNA
jgi:hypothetical protein